MKRVGVVVEPSDIPGCSAVFNPAVHREKEDEIHLLCRIINGEGLSEIRQVILDHHYKIIAIDQESVLVGREEHEKLGCEDPRMVEIDNVHYLTYTAYRSFEIGGNYNTRIGLALSKNLKDFTRLGIVLNELGNNKNGVLLPGKPRDYFCLFHRIYPNVWIAFSEDLINWHDIRPVMLVRPGWWDGVRIGMGFTLLADEGWLAFYHGADQANVYRIGVALFDLEKPDKLLARSRLPILEPGKKYEKDGLVPNVVFTCGGCELNGSYTIFYGGADKVTAVCEISKKKVMNNLEPIY